jgi:hypothetical protein
MGRSDTVAAVSAESFALRSLTAIGRSAISGQTEGADDEFAKTRIVGTPLFRRASGGESGAERELGEDAGAVDADSRGLVAELDEDPDADAEPGIVSRRETAGLLTICTVVVTDAVGTPLPPGRIGTRVALALGTRRLGVCRAWYGALLRLASVSVL